MTDKITFTLQNPIKSQIRIDGKNDFMDLDTLYLKAPSYKEKDKTLVLKKKFIEAIFLMNNSPERQERQEQVGDEKLDSKIIKVVLYAAKDFDIVAYFKQFENLLLNVAFKDEAMEQPLNKLDIQKLDESDFEELLAKYLEVFFIGSWMKTIK